MSELLVDGHRVAWRVLGSGPPLLAPECNYSWTSTMVDVMSDDFTLNAWLSQQFAHDEAS